MRRRFDWHRAISAILAVIIIAGLAVACGADDEPDPTATPEPTPTTATADGELIDADQPRAEPPDITGDESAAFVDGMNGFAFAFYQYAAERGDANLIFSPASIDLAFSMVYAGARGQTEAQMAEVLGFLPRESQHPAANALDQHLSSLGEGGQPQSDQEGEPFQLNVANAVWGQQGYPFLDAFLQTLAEHYGAGMRIVDFIADAEAARLAVNAWVEDRTEGRIKDIVPPGVISAATRLVLANAIYFNAAWQSPFEEEQTSDGTFTLLDGSEVTVPMMRQNPARIPYLDGEGYQAAIMPYAGGDVEMVLVLPEEGKFDQIEVEMDAEYLATIRSSVETGDIVLTMPRFDFESEFDLAAILPEMGMPDAFGPADFSGIAEGSELYISSAIHKATIAVDEEGTEATAATVIVMDESAMESSEMTINRPFIFAIVERETGAVIFLGRVMNPAE